MTVTYTDETLRNDPLPQEDFVPRYARAKTRKKSGLRTWMILAPIGALALVGGGAAMMMNPAETETALTEAAEPAPLIQPAAPLESSAPATLTAAEPLAAASTPAPVVREAPPSPPPAIQRRQAAPVERRAAPAPVIREQTPAEPTGLRPYSAPAATSISAAPAPSAPAITVAPLN